MGADLAVICSLLLAGVGVYIFLGRRRIFRTRTQGSNRTLIYGAGEAGVKLLHAIQSNPSHRYRVVGFVDDAAEKQGLQISGVPVLGGGEHLVKLAARYGVDTVLVALPGAAAPQMSKVLERCHESGVQCKTASGCAEVLEDAGIVERIRDLSIEDLLGRVPVTLDTDRIAELVRNQTILVTGAGGSIGSGLCRQIARFQPARIVGVDLGESALYEIDRHIRMHFPEVPFRPEIANIQDRGRMEELFNQYSPASVFHAAAYKHVPLMEMQPFCAVENNVLGSYNVARAAIQARVKNFVLISTDKAVRPISVMGATKRIAELLLLGMRSEMKIVAVRFGNVLGSNGSVIPVFKNQIASGGPVTVTHREMRRFFMTIPEACQLVLQASAIAESGQICVLDMGEPVKIVDLARNLILLSGLTPEKDIQIEFTGVRPGEKLNEELNSDLELCRRSPHEKITLYEGVGNLLSDSEAWMRDLQEICKSRETSRLLLAIKEIVPDYSPSPEFLKLAMRRTAGAMVEIHRRQAPNAKLPPAI